MTLRVQRRSQMVWAGHAASCLLALLTVPAHGHTLFESSTIARVHKGWVELAVKMSPASAQTLLGLSGDSSAVTPDNLAGVTPELEKLGPQLFGVVSHGVRLAVRRTD